MAGTRRRVVWIAVAVLIVAGSAAALVLTGGSDEPGQRWSDFDRPPYTRGIEVGRTYEYSLSTHCGIHFAQIDGTGWRASPAVDDGNGNPPPRWATASSIGRLTVLNQNAARFTASNGLTARFVRDDLPGRACM